MFSENESVVVFNRFLNFLNFDMTIGFLHANLQQFILGWLGGIRLAIGLEYVYGWAMMKLAGGK